MAANCKTVVLAEVSPATVVANHVNLQRVQRMLQRTASGYKTGSITEGYMERVKLVVASRRFPTISLHTGAGGDTSRPVSPVPSTPSASGGGMPRSGATFVSARARGITVAFPLVNFDPALPNGASVEEDSVLSSAYVVSALEHAFKRTVGPRFVSRMRPQSSSPSNVVVVDVVISKFSVKTHADDAVVPRSVVSSLGDVPPAAAQDWFTSAHSYDGMRISVDGVRFRCYEARFPNSSLAGPVTLVSDVSEWLHGFSLVWCSQLVEVSESSVLVWRAVSVQLLKLPRMLIDVTLKSADVMLSPICVPTLLALAAAWRDTLSDGSIPQSQEAPAPPSAVPTPSIATRSVGQLHRAQSMLSHQVAVAVQTRLSVTCDVVSIRIWTSDMHGVPDTVLTVPEPVLTGYEELCLRVEHLRGCFGSSTKYADGKAGVGCFAVTRRHVPVTVDLMGYRESSSGTPTVESSANTPLLFSGCPFLANEPFEASPSPDGGLVNDCVSVTFRSGSGHGLASVGIARTGCFVTVGAVDVLLSNQSVFELSRIAKAFQHAFQVASPGSVDHSKSVGGQRGQPRAALSGLDVSLETRGNEAASRTLTPPFEGKPDVPDSSPTEPSDSTANPQTFSNWESLFGRLQSLESFSELAGLASRVQTAFSSQDGVRLMSGQVLAHILVEVEKITVQLLAEDQLFASARVDGLRVLHSTETQSYDSSPPSNFNTGSGLRNTQADGGHRVDALSTLFIAANSGFVHLFKGLPYFSPYLRSPEPESHPGMRVMLHGTGDPSPLGISYWASEPGAFAEMKLDKFAAYLDVRCACGSPCDFRL